MLNKVVPDVLWSCTTTLYRYSTGLWIWSGGPLADTATMANICFSRTGFFCWPPGYRISSKTWSSEAAPCNNHLHSDKDNKVIKLLLRSLFLRHFLSKRSVLKENFGFCWLTLFCNRYICPSTQIGLLCETKLAKLGCVLLKCYQTKTYLLLSYSPILEGMVLNSKDTKL